MKVGVISDTHGFLDPAIPELFKGVDHILHAGDIGFASVILELEYIAPVTAVMGNNDHGMQFKETEFVSLADRKFMLHHIIPPAPPSDELKHRLWKNEVQIVVFGHSHRRFCEVYGEVLFLNPGYSGKPKLGLTRSAAVIDLQGDSIERTFIDL